MNLNFRGDELSLPVPAYAVGIKVDSDVVSFFMKLKGETLEQSVSRCTSEGGQDITAFSTASLADDMGVSDGAHVRKVRIVKRGGAYVIEDAGISLLADLIGVNEPLPLH